MRLTVGGLNAPATARPVEAAMRAMLADLFPIHRSTAGPGVRDTLAIVGASIPLTIHKVPTGTKVFDWVIPKEWHIRDAYIADPSGHRVVDYAASNLHVVGHSQPIDTIVSRDELLRHLHTRPDLPSVIPYRTSVFADSWGFCLRHDALEALTEPRYRVVIDAESIDGSLSYGEVSLPGSSDEEIILTTHVCHPSMANDNLSGIVVLAALAAQQLHVSRRYGLRFLFLPGTIGSLAWLSANASTLGRIRHGLVIAGVGDAGTHTYKRTFGGTAAIDQAVELALRDREHAHAVEPFTPWGYDERQFNAPGFRLPVGRLSRTPHGTYPEYHTSADDLDFVHPKQLVDTLDLLTDVLEMLDHDRVVLGTNPHGEPRLGARGLMASTGGRAQIESDEHALLWILSMADGEHRLSDMARRSGLAFDDIAAAADALEAAGLVRPVDL